MKKHIRTACLALGALMAVMAGVPAHAQLGYFAVGSSLSNIYLVRGGATWADDTYVKPVYTGGASISGLAVRGNRVFATDKSTNSLLVGRLGNILSSEPTLADLRTINLADYGVTKPGPVALDESGGVYVISSEKVDGVSKYAYITASGGNWTGSLNVSVASVTALLDDVTGLGPSGALIACDRTALDDVPRVTHAARAIGDTAVEPAVVPSICLPTQPSAAAVLSGVRTSPLAFVTSRTDYESVNDDVTGTLDVFETDSGSGVFSTRLPQGLNPEDLSIFSLDGINYLSLIGRAREQDNVCHAWRIQLSDNGAPLMETLMDYTFTGDTMGGQKCAVSGDGQVFWSTHNGLTPLGATVSALGTANWSGPLWGLENTKNLAISNIAALDYVPEPSSFAALAGLASVCLAGLRRRR